MPKRSDIQHILVIGSGPIVIGQACEFDYSGTQACRALRAEGYRVILINSNPATILTDPELADATYVEPLDLDTLTRVIEKERPNALLPTLGGQTALNLAVAAAEAGVLDQFGVELIGAGVEAIHTAEDRRRFKAAMVEIGLSVPRSGIAYSLEEALATGEEIGYPLICRPSFILGGGGTGFAADPSELELVAGRGLAASPVGEILLEQSIAGWKEYELEVMRDGADNAVVICSIENLDPMGTHTGDSITVAPAQTLTDVEYQTMRDAAFACIRRIGVETGGSNIQFAVNPADGEMVVIEMNPRVSRSSALASKATGFPIAKVAAKLAVGYTLDEIQNDITGATPASFEPTIDYIVTKIPRFTFEKFKGAEPLLSTAMKSVGEVMAIGRSFHESLQKALRGLETGLIGLDGIKPLYGAPRSEIEAALARPTPDRLLVAAQALREGFTVAEIHAITRYDPWFLERLQEIVEAEERVCTDGLPLEPEGMRRLKAMGFSDKRLAELAVRSANLPDRVYGKVAARTHGLIHDTVKALAGATTEDEVRALRHRLGVRPVFKRIYTCAAEFEAKTPYMYSTYEAPSFGVPEDESQPTDRRKIVILGGGPNRIGQGIEFDYCCCHACYALDEAGFETIMVNCNPETVSTDYDTSDRLYFEPLTVEDVLEILHVEKSRGELVQFGGQTPLNLAMRLNEAGVPVIGTSPDSIDLAEDRKRFGALLRELGIPQPDNGTATTIAEAREIAEKIGYPVLVRPSYVLGGRAMAIVYDQDTLDRYMRTAVDFSHDRPVLIDKFLEQAAEFDVDALADDSACVIAGIQEHIEEAGIHSGDSSCVLPPVRIAEEHLETMRHYTRRLATALTVKGLMNIQFAIKDDRVYVLEVNPRASRTVPFVSKATGVPLARIAAVVMAGKELKEFDLPSDLTVDRFYIKSPVFPFRKFPGVDPVLSPEMHSTGEVMGIGDTFGEAYAKAMIAAGTELPQKGTAFISVNQIDKGQAVVLARRLSRLGFELMATVGTASRLREVGLECATVFKVNEGRPNVADHIKQGEIAIVINTPLGRSSHYDEQAIRRAALQYNVPCVTTMTGAHALVEALGANATQAELSVRALQELHVVSATAR